LNALSYRFLMMAILRLLPCLQEEVGSTLINLGKLSQIRGSSYLVSRRVGDKSHQKSQSSYWVLYTKVGVSEQEIATCIGNRRFLYMSLGILKWREIKRYKREPLLAIPGRGGCYPEPSQGHQ
jgi:hypothetical protein